MLKSQSTSQYGTVCNFKIEYGFQIREERRSVISISMEVHDPFVT